jgi:carbonic anhydrase/acetyltransferase-like protein (isoleucine patch superfamily)
MNTLTSPQISPTAFVDPSATILGNVLIGDDVYVAPNASIRADEPDSRIVIGPKCNVQDNVVIHALRGSTVRIGTGTTLAHGAIVHGPCAIGEGCFIGFGSVVFPCTLMDSAVVLHRALVSQAFVPTSRMVATGAVIEGGLNSKDLPEVPEHLCRFVESVRQANQELVRMYGRGRGGLAQAAAQRQEAL